MADENRRLRVVVFPWLAFGHMLPFLELSKALARRGHEISFIATPRNLQRLPKPPPEISNLIHFVPLPLPQVDGLPTDAEATSDLPADGVKYLELAFDRLERPFRQFIQQATPKPDWIIHDIAHHWVPPIAEEAGTPAVFFSIISMGTLVFMGPLSEFPLESSSRKTPEQLTVPPPWIPAPSKLCFRLHEARRLFRDNLEMNLSGVSTFRRMKLTIDGCKAVATRSSMEVEPQWLELLPKLYEKPVIPVGLLQPETEGRGGSEGDYILHWLSKQSSRSVVYIAFGSEAALPTELTHELARGLELAKLPFVWALRKPSCMAADFEELLPEGFEGRTKGYGLIAKGWVPQLKILDHDSVGGFLTHCGWSSVLESFHYGHPLVLLPIFVDQGLVARMVVEKGIAVEIERDEEDGSFTKEAVATAVRLAVVEEEGESMRRRARGLREVLVNEDRQEKYIDEFIDYLQGHEIKTSDA